MTPEERARACLNSLRSKPYPGSHGYREAVAAIAKAIREAEDDALRRMAEFFQKGSSSQWTADEVHTAITERWDQEPHR